MSVVLHREDSWLPQEFGRVRFLGSFAQGRPPRGEGNVKAKAGEDEGVGDEHTGR